MQNNISTKNILWIGTGLHAELNTQQADNSCIWILYTKPGVGNLAKFNKWHKLKRSNVEKKSRNVELK